MSQNPLFKTPEERLAFFKKKFAKASFTAGMPWQHALYTSALAHSSFLILDISALMAAYLVQENEELAGEITRENVERAPTFRLIFNRCRYAADAYFQKLLKNNNPPAPRIDGYPADFTHEAYKALADKIAEEARAADKGFDFDAPKDAQPITPEKAWELEGELVGEKILFTATTRREGDFPAAGRKTTGTVTQVTETKIFVDWDDERDFSLFHGPDTYARL